MIQSLVLQEKSGATGEFVCAFTLDGKEAANESLEKLFQSLNLKLLNRSHPYLREIVIILNYFVKNLKS